MTSAGVAAAPPEPSPAQQVILRSLKQRNVPGTWGRLARRLEDFGVEIRFCYLATDTRIVVGVDDYDRAIAAMQIYGG